MSGEFIAGPHVRAQCRRHLDDLENGHKRGIRFDPERADHALGFYRDVLRLNGGEFEGVPFDLHETQVFIVGSLFGWLNDDGTRRFRVAYTEEAKGNGKSPMVAGAGLYGMVADNEARAEVYSAATKKDQAAILFRDAVAMVDQSPALTKSIRKYGVGDRAWNLFHPRSNSFFRPISADDGQSGPRPHISLIDEVHEHKDDKVIEMQKAGQKGRRQPLMWMITNSGTSKTSVCGEYHDYAIKVAHRQIEDDSFFPYVCALDEGEDPFTDESCWPKTNPLLGVAIQPRYLRDQVRQAGGLPSKVSKVKRLNFCIWVEGGENLIDAETWRGCAAAYTLEDLRGCPCWIGIDLSATRDLTAAVFVIKKDGLFYVWPVFWVPKVGLAEKAKEDKVPYLAWVDAGHLRMTPGQAIDKDFVARDIAKTVADFGLQVQGSPYDRWRIQDFRAACEREGIDLKLVDHGQGFQGMAPAIDELETAIVNNTLRHPGNPVLTWCCANAVVSEDPAGNRKFDKQNATGRIDGMVAMTMAVAVASKAPAPVTPRIIW